MVVCTGSWRRARCGMLREQRAGKRCAFSILGSLLTAYGRLLVRLRARVQRGLRVGCGMPLAAKLRSSVRVAATLVCHDTALFPKAGVDCCVFRGGGTAAGVMSCPSVSTEPAFRLELMPLDD